LIRLISQGNYLETESVFEDTLVYLPLIGRHK
jgi:hypothetical protein